MIAKQVAEVLGFFLGCGNIWMIAGAILSSRTDIFAWKTRTHWASFSLWIVSRHASNKEFSVSAREKDPVEKLK